MWKAALQGFKQTYRTYGKKHGSNHPVRTPGNWCAARALWVERLEDRCLLATLQAISLPDPNQPPSATADGASNSPSISADGRYIAFQSNAPNLVAGEISTDFTDNVFLLDHSNGIVSLVSHLPGAPTTTARNFPVFTNPLISSNGRFVVYSTRATDIIGFDQDVPIVVVYDRTTGLNTLVSHSNMSSTIPAATPVNTECNVDAISGDGRFILFDTRAPDVIPNQQSPQGLDGFPQLFLYDQSTQQTQLVTHAFGQNNLTASADPQDRDSFDGAAIADDGTVVYESRDTNLVNFTTMRFNVYLYSPATQTNQLVTTAAGSSTMDAGLSYHAMISSDGSTVAYASAATDLVANQTGSFIINVFRYSRSTGTTTLVSGAEGSTTASANDDSGGNGYGIAISRDGRFIAFASKATNLVAGQSGTAGNVFLYDAQGPSLTLLSGVNGSTQVGAGGVPDLQALGEPNDQLDPVTGRGSQILSITDNGSLVAYVSHASNIVANEVNPGGFDNVYLYSATTKVSALVSGQNGSPTTTADDLSSFPALSGDGSVLAFHSLADNLNVNFFDANGSPDVFLFGSGSAGVTPASASAFIVPKHPGSSFSTSTSSDGRFTVFTSSATNLIANQTTLNFNQNVFLFDKQLGTTRLVNHVPSFANTTGNGGVSLFPHTPILTRLPAILQPVISADGSFVAFASYDTNLVPGEHFPGGSNLERIMCVYLYSTATGQIQLVNHAPGDDTIIGLESFSPVINADGRYVAYLINAGRNPSPPPPLTFDFTDGPLALFDRVNDATTNVTPASYLTDGGTASGPSISDTGRFVAYLDQGNVDVFDLATQTTVLASHAFGSTTAANAASSSPVVSHDGSYVTFVSLASNLVNAQASSGAAGLTNVFLYKTDGSGVVSLVSGVAGSASLTGNGNSDSPAVDGDGSYIAYRSDSTNLINGQSGAGSDIFEYNRLAGNQTLVSHQAGLPTTAADNDSSEPVIDDDGHLVSFASKGGNLIPGQNGAANTDNVFIWLRQTNANILASGQNGSPTSTGNSDSDFPILTRHSFPGFSSTATNLIARANSGTSFAYINTLVALTLTPNSLADGSPSGTVVGNFSVPSLLAGQFLPPVFTLPAAEENNASFRLDTNAGGEVLVYAAASPASFAVQQSYQVSVHVDVGFGDNAGTLAVNVTLPAITIPAQFAGPNQLIGAAAASNGSKDIVFIDGSQPNTKALLAVNAAAGVADIAYTQSPNSFAGWTGPSDRSFIGNVDGSGDSLIMFHRVAQSGDMPTAGAIQFVNLQSGIVENVIQYSDMIPGTSETYAQLLQGMVDPEDALFLGHFTQSRFDPASHLEALFFNRTAETPNTTAILVLDLTNARNGTGPVVTFSSLHDGNIFGGWIDPADEALVTDTNNDGYDDLVLVKRVPNPQVFEHDPAGFGFIGMVSIHTLPGTPGGPYRGFYRFFRWNYAGPDGLNVFPGYDDLNDHAVGGIVRVNGQPTPIILLINSQYQADANGNPVAGQAAFAVLEPAPLQLGVPDSFTLVSAPAFSKVPTEAFSQGASWFMADVANSGSDALVTLSRGADGNLLRIFDPIQGTLAGRVAGSIASANVVVCAWPLSSGEVASVPEGPASIPRPHSLIAAMPPVQLGFDVFPRNRTPPSRSYRVGRIRDALFTALNINDFLRAGEQLS
jgi:hypothetical protein